MTSVVPRISLGDFLSSSLEKRNDFVNSLGKALSQVGFVTICDHGINQDLIAKMYSEVQQFFKLPLETRKKYENEKLGGQRGFTSFGKEHAKDNPNPDLKEFISWGQPDDKLNLYPPNIDVSADCKGLHVTAESLYREFQRTALVILRAIALFIGIDENYFVDKLENGNSLLRSLHYPPVLTQPVSNIRAAQHEDINLITLLVGASAEGLQLLTKEQQWINVQPQEGDIVVNVGDMLQRLTNKKLVSTTHRVVLPENKELWKLPRYSMPFFTHPRPDVSLKCLPSCISAENPEKWPPITAGEFLIQRLKEIGLIKDDKM